MGRKHLAAAVLADACTSPLGAVSMKGPKEVLEVSTSPMPSPKKTRRQAHLTDPDEQEQTRAFSGVGSTQQLGPPDYVPEQSEGRR
ncbi:unnamed protein product, partial [Chrysoparadoxa australica]